MKAVEFWSEVRKRRNLFFLAAPAWLVIAPVLFTVYSAFLPTFELPALGALVSWMALMWWLQRRLTDMKCFRCGRQAFAHGFFLMRHAKCRSCGAAYGST